MSPKFHTISFNSSQSSGDSAISKSTWMKTMLRTSKMEQKNAEFVSTFQSINDEHASRIYLQSYLLGMEEESFHRMTSPEEPDLVPDFLFQGAKESQLTNSRTIEFQQTERNIPIFGSRAVLEIDQSERSLVSIEATLAEKPDVSAIAGISAEDALSRISQFGKDEGLSHEKILSPELVFFADTVLDKWRLAFYFKNIPVFPPEFLSTAGTGENHRFCVGHSPRHHSPFHDYFVDAHTGEVFYYFSSTPRIDIPVACHGEDDEMIKRAFYGLPNGAGVLLNDPLRGIQTYDYALQDLDNPASAFPKSPILHPIPDFGVAHRPAISAHYNATLVYDFFNHELKRNGIDDKGMVIESVVNVYSSSWNPHPSPTWGNAVWWNKKMWYGQQNDSAGILLSLARYLDVIGHELTHGVTETTSNLIYRDLSGALNESFSDIFGIFIKNWYPMKPNPLGKWDWEMGRGLGSNGGPIRNFSDPAACGQPDHFAQYTPLPISHDSGGVHIYSGIHNLAAYRVLTATGSNGDYIFSPGEVATLYYLTLTRLSRFSKFSDCRRVLINVAGVYYMGDAAEQTKKQNAIATAYSSVGIV